MFYFTQLWYFIEFLKIFTFLSLIAVYPSQGLCSLTGMWDLLSSGWCRETCHAPQIWKLHPPDVNKWLTSVSGIKHLHWMLKMWKKKKFLAGLMHGADFVTLHSCFFQVCHTSDNILAPGLTLMNNTQPADCVPQVQLLYFFFFIISKFLFNQTESNTCQKN